MSDTDQVAAAWLMAARDDLVVAAERLRAKARETGDKTHFATAAGVDLACFRLVELADRVGGGLIGVRTADGKIWHPLDFEYIYPMVDATEAGDD